MSNELYLLAALIIVALAVAVFLINKKLMEVKEAAKQDDTLIEWLKSQQATSQKTSKAINERLDRAARVIAGVQRSIGEMSEIGRGMKDLQEFLRSPKLRGNIGEQVLKELLGQMLPKQAFRTQYSFKSGVKVDAAIKTTAGIIPVDAKFPMENFRKMMKAETEKEKKSIEREFIRNVKKHIDAISTKYILTEEGTVEYALMYLPSEAVYYEVVNNPTLFDYSTKRGVLLVSPTTFYAFLKAVLMSFEGQKIEARARQILSSLRAIQKDYEKTETVLGVLGRHLNNAYNQMNKVVSSFGLLGQKLSSTQAIGEGGKGETKQLRAEGN